MRLFASLLLFIVPYFVFGGGDAEKIPFLGPVVFTPIDRAADWIEEETGIDLDLQDDVEHLWKELKEEVKDLFDNGVGVCYSDQAGYSWCPRGITPKDQMIDGLKTYLVDAWLLKYLFRE